MTPALLARDVRRLLSVPLPWMVLACALAAAALTTLALAAVHGGTSGAATLSALPLLAGLCGALGAGAEYRFGTLHTEVLLHGGRLRFWAGTAAALAAVCALVGAASAAVALLAARATDAATVPPVRLVLIAAVVAAAWALLGAAGAVVAAGQAAAVAALLGYLVVVEPLLEAASTTLTPVLPARASAALLAGPAWPELAPDLLRLLAVTVAGVAVAGVALVRRDVPVTAS